jgi:hypothetical protein
VGGVVPVFILGIHDVAVVAGGGFVLQVGGRIGDPSEEAQGGDQDDQPDDKRQAFH